MQWCKSYTEMIQTKRIVNYDSPRLSLLAQSSLAMFVLFGEAMRLEHVKTIASINFEKSTLDGHVAHCNKGVCSPSAVQMFAILDSQLP